MQPFPAQLPTNLLTRTKSNSVQISPFFLEEDHLKHCFHRKQAKLSTNEKLDFFFTPTKHSAETPGKKLSSFKKRLFFEEEEEQSSQELHLPTLHKAKRTFSESTIVEKRALDNHRYQKIQRKLVDQGLQRASEPLEIPCVHNSEHPELSTIVAKTLNSLIEDKKDLIIIDTRFSFEYSAGHIQGSLNINNPFHLETLFFEYGHLLFSRNFLQKLPQICSLDNKELENWLKTQNVCEENHENLVNQAPIIVIHCEFSQKRGPKLLRYLRKRDREINGELYPNLIYPNVFLLNGGYSNFVKECAENCTENGGYISMFNEKFKLECSFENSSYNKMWKDATNIKFITNFY